MTLKLAASARWFAASPSSSSSPAAARCAGSAFVRGASPLSLDYPSRAFPFPRRTPSNHGGMMNSAVGGAPFPVFDMEEGKKAAAVASRYIPVKGHRALAKLRDSRAVKVGCTLAVWYLFSTASTFTNKILIKEHHVSAEMLTLCHLFMSVLCDFVVLTFPSASSAAAGGGWRMQSLNFKSIVWITPLSMSAVMGKVLTYWSYNAVPVSITATCKASQPFFNVVLAFLVYGSRFSNSTYFSLVPIVFGVVMASVSEMGMNDLAFGGALFAISAAMLGVMQSMYAKFLLRRRIVADAVNLHFYSAVVSFALNAPYVLASMRAQQANFVASFPFGTVLLCSLMHFVGSFSSSWVLGEVSELTFSIMSTMRRVVVILSAVLYFGNPVTMHSVLGMALAVGGVGSYQITKARENAAGGSALPRTVKDSRRKQAAE